MLMNAGKTKILNLLTGKSTDNILKIALGTDNTAAAATQTSLLSQKDIQSASSVVDGSLYKITLTAVFISDGSTYQEVAVYSADGSTMFFRSVITPTVYVSGTLFQVIITISLS